MESAELRIFQAVAREGTITKAAEKLGYVQSNVTARIRQLETELGTALFHRHNRGMILSSAGKTLLDYADKIVGLLDEATKAVSWSDKPGGPLAIGSTQTAAAVRLPKLLASFHREHPDVSLSLTTSHSQGLIDKVLRYELDGAFIGCSCNHPVLRSMHAFDEELVIVAPPAVRDLPDALKKPVLVFSIGCSYREVLESWLETTGRDRTATMEFGTLEAIIGGVGAGLGISLMPRSVSGKLEKDGTLRAFSLPPSFAHMRTEFITRKDAAMSRALEAFIGTIPSPSGIGEDESPSATRRASPRTAPSI
ncbi:LysR family transcriptional regulator [Cohnella suwonensis]|uniref:LysR family transcriptional regulator n=1 Tax=Cohnella suwonensis TaxID=696072 RepID=A0ABW0M2P1_9BACL